MIYVLVEPDKGYAILNLYNPANFPSRKWKYAYLGYFLGTFIA